MSRPRGASRAVRTWHRRLVAVVVALLAGVLPAVVLVPTAEARYPYGTMRDTRATLATDEVLTVDVLGIDDPPAGRTWERSSVCLSNGFGDCLKAVDAGGFRLTANDDGTVTAHRPTATAGSVKVGYRVDDSGDGRYSAFLVLTAQPTGTLAGEPDPAVRTRVRVTTWKRFVSFDHAGQEVRLVSTVANKGNVALEDLRLTNASPNIPAPTCAPVAVGGTLPVGGSTTCTSVLTVTQDLVDLNVQRVSSPVATGRAVRGGITYRARAAGLASAGPIQLPHLAMSGSVEPATVTSPDQPVAYAYVVRNDGKVTVRNLLVRAPFPGLAALVCAPVALGGTLAPGQATTCRGSRTVPPALLSRTSLTDTAKASAQTYQRTVNAASTLDLLVASPSPLPRVPVAGPGPVARSDALTTAPGRPVVVDVLANDSAGSASSPLDGTSVRLRLEPSTRYGAVLYGDTKALVVPAIANRAAEPLVAGAAFLVSGRGEVTVVPLTDAPSDPITVGYQVADADGRTSRSTLTVTVAR